MVITLTDLIIWIILAIIIGAIGELIARRRAPDGIIGAAIVGFIAMFIIVGVLHFSIAGEPRLGRHSLDQFDYCGCDPGSPLERPCVPALLSPLL